MAFMGIIFANFVLLILFILSLIDLLFLILFIVFLVLSLLDKTKKWKKVLCTVFGILFLTFIIPFIILYIKIKDVDKREIIDEKGNMTNIEDKYINNFFINISNCDTSKLDENLDKYPSLIYSYSYESLTPLGASIKSKDINCVKYFVEKDVDINKIGKDNKTGTIEFVLSRDNFRDNYNEEIFKYLLDQDEIDVNKKFNIMPTIQSFIKIIASDNVITDDEVTLFKKMLDKGADINDVNGVGDNAINYIENEYNNVENIDIIKELLKG